MLLGLGYRYELTRGEILRWMSHTRAARINTTDGPAVYMTNVLISPFLNDPDYASR
jgi:hypothetical protein